MLNRRVLLTSTLVASGALLAGCDTSGGSSPAVTLATAQAYAADLVNAVSAAAQAYLASSPSPTAAAQALVKSIVTDLQTLNTAVQSVTDTSAAKSTILQILAGVNQLVPIVSPFLGTAGPYVPLAIAVIEAFVQSLPPPANSPTSPPAELHRMALKYNHH